MGRAISPGMVLQLQIFWGLLGPIAAHRMDGRSIFSPKYKGYFISLGSHEKPPTMLFTLSALLYPPLNLHVIPREAFASKSQIKAGSNLALNHQDSSVQFLEMRLPLQLLGLLLLWTQGNEEGYGVRGWYLVSHCYPKDFCPYLRCAALTWSMGMWG